MTHLIQLMLKNGELTPEQAAPLLREAEQGVPAKAARPQKQTAKAPTQAAAAAKPAAPPAAVPAEDESSPLSMHVTYVPELVRQQIASEVKQELLQEEQQPGWSGPAAMPEWTQRIRVFGDIRLRGEGDMLPGTNDPFFTDFNTINGSANGFDDTSGVFPPLLNMTEDRFRFRLRARVGVDAQLADWMMAEIRLGTGNDRNPVSENQTLGAGGDFSKYQIWLDRAYIDMHPTSWLGIDVGRSPDPFWTTALLFYPELNFDGISFQLHHALTRDIDGFLTFGGFPVFNTSFNFGLTSTSLEPVSSHDSYLAAIQAGADWRINDIHRAKLALGYFDFINVQGATSAPCLSPVAFGSCNTDNTIPGWIQFGNSVFPVRTIAPNPASGSAVTANPQFFGLASRFELLDIHGEYTLARFHPIDVVFAADFVKNFGFNRSAIAAKNPVNNIGDSPNNLWSGGDNGYLVQVTIGHQQLEKLWDWNMTVGYRYIESDAVLDALTDSDWYPGGTNAKIYTIAANVALNKFVWFDSRFYSATQISGPNFQANTLLVDLNAKF